MLNRWIEGGLEIGCAHKRHLMNEYPRYFNGDGWDGSAFNSIRFGLHHLVASYLKLPKTTTLGQTVQGILKFIWHLMAFLEIGIWWQCSKLKLTPSINPISVILFSVILKKNVLLKEVIVSWKYVYVSRIRNFMCRMNR